MRKYLFFLLLLPVAGLCQEAAKTVIYRLDIVQKDSFYLLEKSYVPAGGRRDTLNNYILFKDTVAFRLYYENLLQQSKGLTNKIDFLTAERDSLRARALRLASFQTALNTFVSNQDDRFSPMLQIEATKPDPPPDMPKPKPPPKKKKKQ